MRYIDRVYGECEITEPVVLELMASSSLQRLQRINQFGYGPFWAKEFRVRDYEHNRFSHSVGTYLLLKRYGAPLEEQVAGLIHDVSHTAFSHCTEYVLNSGNEEKQTYQDSILDIFVRQSEIPGILKKYGINLGYLLDDNNFPLKEKSLPDLCADRIDYVLRDALVFSELDEVGAGYILDNLAAENDTWFFRSFEGAKKYADLFSRMNKIYYSGMPSARMFCAVSEFLKYALASGYIAEEDLRIDDDAVMDKARGFIDTDENLRLLFERMDGEIGAINEPENFDMEAVCKSRSVDPFFRYGGGLKRISGEDANWKDFIAGETKPKRYFVKWDR